MPIRLKLAFLPLLLSLFSINAGLAQEVTVRQVNAARNIRGQGTSLNTNASFSLRMTLAGDSTLIDTASVLDAVSIKTVIRPESEDIGEPADIIIVDAAAASGFTMRNQDGNFVTWNGRVPDLVPYLEGVSLDNELEVEIFNGELGVSGAHRIFVGFLVRGDTLFFTPSALKITITEADPLEEAMSLFNTAVSPLVIQGKCIECHIKGGVADPFGVHLFVPGDNPDHLSINFEKLVSLFNAKGRDLILRKARGLEAHVGGVVITPDTGEYQVLDEFLRLLEQAEAP